MLQIRPPFFFKPEKPVVKHLLHITDPRRSLNSLSLSLSRSQGKSFAISVNPHLFNNLCFLKKF